MQAATARLNGFVGDSLLCGGCLELEVIWRLGFGVGQAARYPVILKPASWSMKDTDDLRVRVLRAIAEDLGAIGVKMDMSRPDVFAEIMRLPKYIAGEHILRRYAMAGIDRQLAELARRVTALEDRERDARS